MIQYVPPTKRRRWPGVLLLAVVLVVFLLLISACGSDHDPAPKPAPVTTTTQPTTNPIQPGVYESHTGGSNWPEVRSYCDPNTTGIRIYVTEDGSYSSEAGGGGVSVIIDPNCNGR